MTIPPPLIKYVLGGSTQSILLLFRPPGEKKMDSGDLVLLTAPQLSREAFGEMLRDYSRAGTPFLGMYDQSDYDDFCAMCVMHSQGNGFRTETPLIRVISCATEPEIYALRAMYATPPHPNLRIIPGIWATGCRPPCAAAATAPLCAHGFLKQHGSITIP